MLFDTLPTVDEGMATMSDRRGGTIRSFHGWQRSTHDWDGLRRDKDLWFQDGNCLVHLYTLGGSQRGPSLRLRYSDVEALRSEYLLEQCLHIRDLSSPIGSDDGASDSGYASSRTSTLDAKHCDLYIPTPAHLTREQAYSYHLTTRNFFAYASSKPVVGEKLGVALANLLDRMREWQPKTAALANFASYCQEQGYSDMADNPDYALACLVLAEHAKLKDLWIESYVHCAGMHEQLDRSSEYEALSNTTKAMITRASLEMDLHISRVTRALGSFLEEELGPEHLGLSKAARDHLDRFRSCLHKYYVDKLGYFPPDEEGPWNKRLWTKMYHAFQTLYEYLVDNDSTTDLMDGRGMTGGICVVQNVQAFDQQHGYTPLPHPLPLLPELPTKRRAIDQQKGLRNFKLGRMESSMDRRVSARQALAKATNSGVQDVMGCELVQEYQRFERQQLEEKLSLAEARKVRWLLIYSTLQMLISITRAPSEIRDTETPTYPLCVLTSGCPGWLEEEVEEEMPTSDDRTPRAVQDSMLAPPTADEAEERISIHPDCEADNAEDYFASGRTISRQPSQLSLELAPSTPRRNTQLSRTASIRSSALSGVHALHKSFVGSLSRRSSLRTTPTIRPLSKSSSFCEIVIAGYGNGADGEEPNTYHQSVLSMEELQRTESVTTSIAAFDFGLDDVSEEPTLEDCHVDGLLHDSARPQFDFGDLQRSESDSSLSAMTSNNSGSSRSSTYMAYADSPATELSYWDSDESKRSSEIKSASSAFDLTTDRAASKRHSYQQRDLNFGVKFGVQSRCFSVSAGCYTPTGLINLPLSKFHQQRSQSSDSATSTASSQYLATNTQAADIEQDETRGRRRLRALDRVSQDEIEAEGRVLCFVE